MGELLIQEGYIMIARKIRKSPTWQCLNIAHRIVMLELLLQAQHTPQFVSRNGEKIWLDRGQIATSYQQLANDVNSSDITPKVVRGAINKLEKLEFLAKDEAKARAKKGLLLTIVNWDLYQCPDNYKGKVEDKETGKARAKQGQSKGKARAINKNDNNEYNAEKDINNTPPISPQVDDDKKESHAEEKLNTPFKTKEQEQLFAQFWNEYPKKVAKRDAERAWSKIPLDDLLFKRIMAGLDRARASPNWIKDKGQYIPHPATWLNGKRWEDEHGQYQAPGEEEIDFGFRKV